MFMYIIPRLVVVINLVLETSVVLHFENYMPYSSIMIECLIVRFEVLTVLTGKITVLWNVTQCCLVDMYQTTLCHIPEYFNLRSVSYWLAVSNTLWF